MHLESREAVERYDFLKEIVEYVAVHPSSTIPEIVESTTYSYTAVKHALDELVKQGVLKTERRLNAKRGRPAAYFTLDKPFMIIAPPRQYLYLSKMMVQGLLDRLGLDGVKKFFSDLGEKMGTEAARSISPGKGRMSIAEYGRFVERYLNQLGAHAKTSTSGGRISVTMQNCIFYEVSKEYEGLTCEAHESFFRAFFKAIANITLINFSHEQCMAKGDDRCLFRIELSN
jgi:predicted ArsR family transcriptional regulator